MMDLQKIREMESELKGLARLLKCGIFEVADRVKKLINRIELLQKERDELNAHRPQQEG
jgi:hypothetical protein